MKQQTINKLITTFAICSIGFLSAAAYAGPDANQLEMNRRFTQAKQKLQQAEAAKGAERQKLLGEHMKMMHDNMKKMEAMKPKAGMTMQEHEDWINEHQKLMEQAMEQMMGDHHLLMGTGDMPMDSGDAHKH